MKRRTFVVGTTALAGLTALPWHAREPLSSPQTSSRARKPLPKSNKPVASTEASVGNGVLSSAQRRCLLWASGIATHGEFRVVLHVTGNL